MHLSGKTVLVVDDEVELCDVISTELRNLGALPIQSHQLNDALAILKATKVDLVISDIRMPGTSGIELLNIIRQTRVDIPVVLVTGFADITLVEKLAQGAEAVMNRPSDLDQVYELYERLVMPLTQRWIREQLSPAKDLPEKNLSSPGAIYQVTIDRGSRPDKTFEVICR